MFECQFSLKCSNPGVFCHWHHIGYNTFSLVARKKWLPSMHMSFLQVIVKVQVKPCHGNLSKVWKNLPSPWSSLPILSRMRPACPGASKEAKSATSNLHGNNYKVSTLSHDPEKAHVTLQLQLQLLLAFSPNSKRACLVFPTRAT